MNACNGIISKWKAAHKKCTGNFYKPIVAISKNINSPAYKLPNKRKANDKGRANKVTISKIKLTGYKDQ